jgi:hypothetical protein
MRNKKKQQIQEALEDLGIRKRRGKLNKNKNKNNKKMK